MNLRKTTRSIKISSVVGTVYDKGSLDAAIALTPGAVDLVELRIDAFASNRRLMDRLEKAAQTLTFPLVVTVRHPAEGGGNDLSAGARRELFNRFLPLATWIDVELRSAKALADVVESARALGKGVIFSHHDFKTTPTLAKLKELVRRASEEGGDIFKVAATTKTARGLSTLLQFLTEAPTGGKYPALAVMGMGEFGKISRLVLGRSGSVLNYGYLAGEQVSGQWPAKILKERLQEL